jgi:multidrug resistance efflux pump
MGDPAPHLKDDGPAPLRLATISAVRLVYAPQSPRLVARWLGRGLALFLLLIALLPWQQTSLGVGRVLAWAPEDRQQAIDAPVAGVVDRWHVREGDRVAAGAPIVSLRDNDPALVARLEAERETLVERQRAAEAKATAYQGKLDAMLLVRDAGVGGAEAKVRLEEQELDAAEQKRIGDAAAVEAARLNLERTRSLHANGLKSQFDLEQAQLRWDTATATLAQSEAKVQAGRNKLDAARQDREKALREGDGKVAEAQAELEDAMAGIASAQARILELDVTLARQTAQTVTAPRGGTVFRLYGGQGGEQVKAGDSLVVLVPDTESRAVELFVDGNDAPLLQRGQKVRIQFEGWPAVQFAGWPSVAVGTFGGVVRFIDEASGRDGQFRILIEADPDDTAWPEARFLRQGVHAKGWVLLAQVPVAFELWRQLNNFPPSVDGPPGADDAEPPQGAGGSKGADKGKDKDKKSKGDDKDKK